MSSGRSFRTAVLDTRHGALVVGSLICSDREFPEGARTLAANDGHVGRTYNRLRTGGEMWTAI